MVSGTLISCFSANTLSNKQVMRLTKIINQVINYLDALFHEIRRACINRTDNCHKEELVTFLKYT